MKPNKWIYKIWYLLTFRFRKARISITSARLSGDGSLIDIRYWLSRPDKLHKNYHFYLLDEVTKEKFYPVNLIKYGTVRTKHGKHTTSGVILFYNRDKKIKVHSKVVLIIDSLLSEQIEIV